MLLVKYFAFHLDLVPFRWQGIASTNYCTSPIMRKRIRAITACIWTHHIILNSFFITDNLLPMLLKHVNTFRMLHNVYSFSRVVSVWANGNGLSRGLIACRLLLDTRFAPNNARVCLIWCVCIASSCVEWTPLSLGLSLNPSTAIEGREKLWVVNNAWCV